MKCPQFDNPEKDCKVISALITKAEMPKKLPPETWGDVVKDSKLGGSMTDVKLNYRDGFNTALQECRPYITKLTLRAEKAERQIGAGAKDRIKTMAIIWDKNNELAQLKKEKEELEKLLAHILPKDWDKVKHGCLIKMEEYDKMTKRATKAEQALTDIRGRTTPKKIEIAIEEEGVTTINIQKAPQYREEFLSRKVLAQAISKMINEGG